MAPCSWCCVRCGCLLWLLHVKFLSSLCPLCGRELLDTVKARKLAYYGHTTRKQGSCLENEIKCKEQCQMHAGEEDHARPGWTTSRCGQVSPWRSQSEWQRTEINGESTSRTAKEQNSPCRAQPKDVPGDGPFCQWRWLRVACCKQCCFHPGL